MSDISSDCNRLATLLPSGGAAFGVLDEASASDMTDRVDGTENLANQKPGVTPFVVVLP
jgi:hypothetical protein